LRILHVLNLVKKRRKQRNAREKSIRQSARYLLEGIGAVLAILGVASFVMVAYLYAGLVSDLPSLDTISLLLNPVNGKVLNPTILTDNSGEHEIYRMEIPSWQRKILPIDPQQPDFISTQLVRLTVSSMQPDFWQSSGVNWQKLTTPQPSTIAEHLASSLLLEQEPNSLRRALRMRLLALQLTARYGRSQILEWYLNSLDFGHQAYGAPYAARLFLDRPVSQLTISESALLIASSQTPALNPIDSPTAALENRDHLLRQFAESGIISQDELNISLDEKMTLQKSADYPDSVAPAFTRLALQQAYDQMGRQRVERGGLVIRTSMDFDLQTQARCTSQIQLQHLTGGNTFDEEKCKAARLLPALPPGTSSLSDDVRASVVLLDVKTGQALAVVGDLDNQGNEQMLQRHAPGSLLTPFVAVTAFSRGFNPSSLVWDAPGMLDTSLSSLQNPDGKSHGALRLRTALANDYVLPLAQIMIQVGPQNIWRLLEPLGFANLANQQADAGVLFKGGELNPLEVGWTYNVFANLGEQTGVKGQNGSITPAMILTITDSDGNEVWSSLQPESQAVFSQALAYLVHHILSDENARRESLGYPNPLEIGRPAGAKIGQAENGTQSWTAGYVPQVSLVTWIGYPQSDEEYPPINPRWTAGLWQALIQYSIQNKPVEDWSLPNGVVTLDVCDPSGLLPTVDCPNVVKEVFLSGNEPTAYDNLYQVVAVNRETNRLATVFTPLELVEERTYLSIPEQARDWARANGLPIAPTDYDLIQAPPMTSDVHISSPQSLSYVNGKVIIRGSATGEGFSSYRLQVGEGLNPRTWTEIGSQQTAPVTNDVLGEWVTGKDGLYALRLTVTRQDQRVENAIIQLTVDNTPPQVTLVSPLDGAEISSETSVLIQAEVQDSAGVSKVEWLIDGKVESETLQAPYNYFWQTEQGKHNLSVRAYDTAGNSAESPAVQVIIQ
jgi:membrane peptidoglycan carboxypeptidase